MQCFLSDERTHIPLLCPGSILDSTPHVLFNALIDGFWVFPFSWQANILIYLNVMKTVKHTDKVSP